MCRHGMLYFKTKKTRKKTKLTKMERAKKKEAKKETASKSRIEKTNDKKKTGFNCSKGVKLTHLACSLCKLVHKKCVPYHHKMQIPNRVEDYYVCHMFSLHRHIL